MRHVLLLLYKTFVTLNLNKCKFFADPFLGHINQSNHLELAERTRDVLKILQHPPTQMHLELLVRCKLLNQFVSKAARLPATYNREIEYMQPKGSVTQYEKDSAMNAILTRCK